MYVCLYNVYASTLVSVSISVYFRMSVCLSLFLSLSGLLVDPSLTFQPTYLPALSTRLSIRPSRSSFVQLSLHLSKDPSIAPFVIPSVCPLPHPGSPLAQTLTVEH